MKPALVLAALLGLAIIAIHASAATITPSDAAALKNLILSANTTYTISSENNAIVIQNTDVNNTLLLVFNPALRITLFNVSGAHAILVNNSNTSVVVEDILGNATSYDVVGYGGEVPGLALALVIPANSSASIGAVYYTAPGEGEAESLSAIAPPEGYRVVGDYYGTEDKTWSYTVSGTKTIWVAFYQGDADTSNPSDLVIEVYNSNVYQAGEIPLRIDPGHVKYILYGKNGEYETKVFGASGIIVFHVKTYASDWKTAWRVIYAVAKDKPNPEPEPTTTTKTPAAKLPSKYDAKTIAVAVGALFFLAILALAFTGARRG